jgi:predicted nuclease of predicted toxin-antitoxin system
MRFLANMGISPVTVAFLPHAGHEAIHLHEEGLDNLPDSQVLQKAHLERRVLLTSDLDFGDLLAASGAALPTVVVFRLRSMVPDNVNRHVTMLLAQHSAELEAGAVVSVAEDHIRVRRLPIE